MKKLFLGLIIGLVFALSGCVGVMQKSIRSKLPAFQADEFKATLSVTGGGGAQISGTNVVSDGKGNLTADEYSESVNTPWAGWVLDAKGAVVGKPKLPRPAVIITPAP